MVMAVSLQDRWSKLCVAQDESNKFVEVLSLTMMTHFCTFLICTQELLEKFEEAEQRLDKAELLLLRERESAERYHVRFQAAEATVVQQGKEMVRLVILFRTFYLTHRSPQDSNGFVSVLIDGDCMNVRFAARNPVKTAINRRKVPRFID